MRLKLLPIALSFPREIQPVRISPYRFLFFILNENQVSQIEETFNNQADIFKNHWPKHHRSKKETIYKPVKLKKAFEDFIEIPWVSMKPLPVFLNIHFRKTKNIITHSFYFDTSAQDLKESKAEIINIEDIQTALENLQILFRKFPDSFDTSLFLSKDSFIRTLMKIKNTL